MIRRTSLILPALVLLSSVAMGECKVPDTLGALPDGKVADKTTMLNAHRQVWDYVEAADSYLDCLDREEAAQAGKETDSKRRQRIQAYNTIVAEMSTVTDKLKQEIAAFNSRR